MKNGEVRAYYGSGKGKSDAAVGYAIRALSENRRVIMIQFLKGSQDESEILNRLEPELKVFRFEKSLSGFQELSEKEQEEERLNIRNGLNFARKVLTTRECDVLILDEIFGIVDCGIISAGELINLIELRESDTSLVLTGQKFLQQLKSCVDVVSLIQNAKLMIDNS